VGEAFIQLISAAATPEVAAPTEALLEVAAFPDDGICAICFNFWHKLARQLVIEFNMINDNSGMSVDAGGRGCWQGWLSKACGAAGRPWRGRVERGLECCVAVLRATLARRLAAILLLGVWWRCTGAGGCCSAFLPPTPPSLLPPTPPSL
jgi:hypothetical protein